MLGIVDILDLAVMLLCSYMLGFMTCFSILPKLINTFLKVSKTLPPEATSMEEIIKLRKDSFRK